MSHVCVTKLRNYSSTGIPVFGLAFYTESGSCTIWLADSNDVGCFAWDCSAVLEGGHPAFHRDQDRGPRLAPSVRKQHRQVRLLHLLRPGGMAWHDRHWRNLRAAVHACRPVLPPQAVPALSPTGKLKAPQPLLALEGAPAQVTPALTSPCTCALRPDPPCICPAWLPRTCLGSTTQTQPRPSPGPEPATH